MVHDYNSYGGASSQNRMGRQQKQVVMFEPKRNASLSLICTDNSAQELNYMLNSEYNLMREKQDLMD